MSDHRSTQSAPFDDEDTDAQDSSATPNQSAQKSSASYGNLSKALGHTSYQELENKLNETEAKLNETLSLLEDAKNQELRAVAELDNVRKRAEKDISNARKYSLERLINELLPVIDSLERGLDIDVGGNEFAKRVHEGMDMTLQLFMDTLKKFAVTVVNPVGEPFNPTLHQAISTQENTEVVANTVLQVLQKGYLLHDRLIRPALVVVSN